MLAAFAEAIRATTQPCTLLVLLPSLVMAVVTRGRWAPFVAICIGAVLGGWLFVANVVALSDGPLQVSGVLVGALIILAITSPSMPWPRWAEHRSIETATAGVVGFVATLWWRPCIGTELGSILTSASEGITGQLPGISAYMLGTTMPVLAAVLVVRAIDPAPETARRVTWVAGGIGVVVAGALAIGRHDELVTTLTRWTTT